MTLGTIRTNVANVLGLDNSAGGDQPMIDQWANEAVLDILLQTDCYVDCANMTLTSGTADYDLSSSILKIRYAYLSPVGGSDRLMQRIAPFEILDFRLGSADNSGQPYKYAIQGDNLLMVYPTPAAADVMRVYYVPRPSVMSSDAHDPATTTYGLIPAQYHDLIVDYTLWRGADHEEASGTQDPEKYAQRYMMGLKDIIRDLNKKGGVRMPQAVRARSRARGFSNNDVYPRL